MRETTDSLVRRRALEGMTAALANRQTDAPAGWKETLAVLVEDRDELVNLTRSDECYCRSKNVIPRLSVCCFGSDFAGVT